MKYFYLSAFRLDGVTLDDPLSGELPLPLADDGGQAVITNQPNPHLIDIDRQKAVARMLLEGQLDGAGEDAFEHQLRQRMHDTARDRERDHGSGPFLVFRFRGEVDLSLSLGTRELGPFAITFESLDGAAICRRYDPAIGRVLAGLMLAADGAGHGIPMAHGIYLEDDNGLPLYCYNAVATQRARPASPLGKETTARVSQAARRLAELPELYPVHHLMQRAADPACPPLPAFLMAWTALEGFTDRAFARIKAEYLDTAPLVASAGAAPEAPGGFAAHLGEILGTQTTASDRFGALAAVLSDTPGEDRDTYAALARLRAHLQPDTAPTGETLTLLRRYLEAFLARPGATPG